jgi:PPOX class probable FMN-dependent enzyme
MREPSAVYPDWHQSLLRSLEGLRDTGGARFVQLATMGEAPDCRTVVFRGFLANTSSLMFATDCRSEKVRQVQEHPDGTACWYFSQSREQYRITGTLHIIDENCDDIRLEQARSELWRALSKSVKAQFYWPVPRTDRSERFEKPEATESCPSSFCLLILKPCKVDYLHLGFTPHLRVVHEKRGNSSWAVREVNP